MTLSHCTTIAAAVEADNLFVPQSCFAEAPAAAAAPGLLLRPATRPPHGRGTSNTARQPQRSMLMGRLPKVDGDEKFASLEAAGLKISKTIGDGDCLFRALSDQLYGEPGYHLDIRREVVKYEAEHPEEFMDFVVATRKREQPKRKNAAQFASTGEPPSEKKRQAKWEKHLKAMATSGIWGENAEIVAFTRAYGVDVKVWHWNQQDWLIKAKENAHDGLVLHVAYHRFNHYSTVRNIDGPDTGLPHIREKETGPRQIIVEVDAWKVTEVRQSLFFYTTDEAIEQALLRFAGNTGDAIHFLENEYRSSLPSTPGSTSTQRDLDDDDEAEFSGPAKKQDRAGSRNRNRDLTHNFKSHRVLDKKSGQPFLAPSKLSQEESLPSGAASGSSSSLNSLIDRIEMPVPRRKMTKAALLDSDNEPFTFEAGEVASDTDSSLAPSVPRIKLRVFKPERESLGKSAKQKKHLGTSTKQPYASKIKQAARGQLKQKRASSHGIEDPPANGVASISL